MGHSRRKRDRPASKDGRVAELRSAGQAGRPTLRVVLLALAVLAGAFILYSPALKGGFVFDDLSLSLAVTPSARGFHDAILKGRPVLLISYLLNAVLLGNQPFSYHVVNVLIHAIN